MTLIMEWYVPARLMFRTPFFRLFSRQRLLLEEEQWGREHWERSSGRRLCRHQVGGNVTRGLAKKSRSQFHQHFICRYFFTCYDSSSSTQEFDKLNSEFMKSVWICPVAIHRVSKFFCCSNQHNYWCRSINSYWNRVRQQALSLKLTHPPCWAIHMAASRSMTRPIVSTMPKRYSGWPWKKKFKPF